MNKAIDILVQISKLQTILNSIALVYSLNGRYYEINEGIEIPKHEMNRPNLLYLGEGKIYPMLHEL